MDKKTESTVQKLLKTVFKNKKTALIAVGVLALAVVLCLIFPGLPAKVLGLLGAAPQGDPAATSQYLPTDTDGPLPDTDVTVAAPETDAPTDPSVPESTASPVTDAPAATSRPEATTSVPQPKDPVTTAPETQAPALIDKNGTYTKKEDVALYIHTYGVLPKNFITKAEAEKLGWSSGAKLDDYAKGKCIGGDYFGNYEGILPKKSGRKYTECDIDTLGVKARGVKRIVFSNDGLVYYTEDHYEHFTLLYGTP